MAHVPEHTETPGESSLGLTRVRDNAAIAAEEEQKAQQFAPAPPQITRLAGHIQRCWDDSTHYKICVEEIMMKSLRQRHGVYEPLKKANIAAMGGTDIYMLLTSTKCRAAEAWIEDILSPVAEQPWSIKPTPIPELPQEIEAQVQQEVVVVRRVVLQQAVAAQERMQSAELDAEMAEYADRTRDVMLEEMKAEAQLRADRMSDKIADQLQEGGWHDAFEAVRNDLMTLKAGILKGPVLRNRKRKKWGKDENGKTVVVVEEMLVPEFERVSPFDLYPAPGSRGVDDDYLLERHRLTRNDLVSFLGVPGFNDAKVRQVLYEYGKGGYREEQPPDNERRIYEQGNQDTGNLTWIEAHQFWGTVPGLYLTEWGFEGEIDPNLEYQIDAWMVGSYVIRAVLNPDKLGRKPYNVSGYEKVPGSFWYKGVPELMPDLQDMCNTVGRALANNAAFASGPMVEIDLERIPDGSTAIHPWKIFETENRQMNESPAVRYYQPQLIIEGLLKAFDFFMTMAEDQTGIPRWASGNSNLGGAASTSSGLSMIMTAATRGIKKVVGHVDEIIEGAVGRLYDYNMVNDADESIKGDCNVIARGTSALVEREQKILRRTEFLALTGNPIDVQLLGPKNRAKMLRQHGKDLGLDIDETEDLELFVAQVVAQLQAQGMGNQGAQPVGAPAQPPGSNPPPAKPPTRDNAGNPAGGTADNLAQNQPGVRPGV